MSDYCEAKVADHILRTSSFTKPSGIWIALCTAAPSDSSTGSTITEPSSGGYARYSMGAPLDATWTRASSTTNAVANAAAISWTASGGNYGTITHVCVVDASTAGNILFHGALSASKTINDGDTFTIAIGGLSITFA